MRLRKRGLCCRSVSLCLPVTLLDGIHKAEDIVKSLVRLCSPIILVFLTRAQILNSMGNPFSADAKYTGVD